MHRALVLVIAVTACTSDTELARQTYIKGAFCPPERVRVVAHPELALFNDDAVTRTPWHEPVLPPEVAADSARLAMWQRKRDADHATWEQELREVMPSRRDTSIQQVDGCDGTQLWICGYGRHGGCGRLADAGRGTLLVCSDGRAARYADGAFSCAEQPPFSRARCAAHCPTGEYRCVLACADGALDECRRDGLDALGMCGGLVKDRDQLASSVAQVESASEAAAMSVELKGCIDGCARAIGCMGACFAHAADRCEARRIGDTMCKQLRRTVDTYQQLQRR